MTMLKGVLWGVCGVLLVAAIGVFVFLKTTGLSARATPGPLETALARRARAMAIPAAYAARTNPVPATAASITSGMEHFSDHCASCHAIDGSGDTEMGKGLFPPSPDMRAAATQSLTDAELFYIIEHGVRFTGMPGWSTGTAEGEESSWHLVNFIRHLPQLTSDERDAMNALTPRSPAQVKQEMEEEQFLAGTDSTP
jgi:mono/diheme cytochrome c family protein